MVYSDLLFFLGLLPASVLLSFLDRSAEYKNLILILTSAIFVAWAKPVGVLAIFITVIFEYLLGLGIGKVKETNTASAKVLLAADLLMNCAVALVFGHNYIFSEKSFLHLSDALLPIGAAYYAVKGFSYCWDVYKGNCAAEKNIFCLMTYMTSYHFLAAGPVVRYGDIEPQIRKRTVTGKDINEGLNSFIIGLGKVVLIASVFNRMKLSGLNAREITFLGCWFGMIAFFAEAYFTLSGLSDMAWGLGRMNGFTYPFNYSDIGINGLLGGLVKSYNTTLVGFYEEVFSNISKGRKTAGIICTVLCGAALAMWYHVSVNFLVCGIAAGAVIALEKYVYGKRLTEARGWIKFIYLLAVSMAIFGGMYFSSLYGYRKWLFALIGVGNDYTLSVSMKNAVLNNIVLIIIAFISVCAPLRNAVRSAVEKYAQGSARRFGQIEICKTVFRCAVLLLCILTLAAKIAAVQL